MQKEEYFKIVEEMKPYMIDGKITEVTELKWLQDKKVLRYNEDTGEITLIMYNGYKTRYKEFCKKLDEFWRFRGYLEKAKGGIKKKEVEDEIIEDAVSKF